MGQISELFVKLSTDPRKFEKGMKRGSKSVDGFAGRVKSASGVLKSFGTLLAAGFATRFVFQTVDAADKVGKLSIRLGLATEFLSEMQFAADRSGVKLEAFNMAMQRSQRRLGQFRAEGKGEVLPALQLLGDEFVEMARKGASIEDLLPKIADRLNQFADAGQKAFIAQKLFDSEGVAMLQLLAEGSVGMAKLRDEAKAMGLSISQLAADDAADFNDAWTNLTKTISGAAASLVRDLTPGLALAIEGLTDLAELLKGPVTDAWKAWKSVMQPIFFEIGRLTGALETMGSVAQSTALESNAFFKRQRQGLQQQAQERSPIQQAFQRQVKPDIGPRGPGLGVREDGTLGDVRGGFQAAPGTEAIFAGFDDIAEKGRSVIEQLKPFAEEVTSTISGTVEGIQATFATTLKATGKTSALVAAQFSSSIGSIAQTAGQTLASVIATGGSAAQAWGAVLQSVLSSALSQLFSFAATAIGLALSQIPANIVAAEARKEGIIGALVGLAASGAIVAATLAASIAARGKSRKMQTGGIVAATGLVQLERGERVLNEREVNRTRPFQEVGQGGGFKQSIVVKIGETEIGRMMLETLHRQIQMEVGSV